MVALHSQYPEGKRANARIWWKDEPLLRCRNLERLFASTTVCCILNELSV
jgi:hypothetical protein